MIHAGLAMLLNDLDGLVYSESAASNIFLDEAPTEPNRCVTLYPIGGSEADAKLPYDPGSTQIVVRSDDIDWAMSTWSAIYTRLHALRNTTLPDGTYLAFALVVQAAPVRLGTDQNGRYRYSMNVRTESVPGGNFEERA